MTHPYSIFVWKPPLKHISRGEWFEPVQCYTQEYAVYVANLIHQDSHSVIKVERYGLIIACFPNKHAVELVEQQIAKQEQRLLHNKRRETT